ncbi:MAG: signal peptidase I [Candidatus Zambryskibacteria bacterium]|nr:signal peptidase I [Candidatus Zambryskibacteria bacterium]
MDEETQIKNKNSFKELIKYAILALIIIVPFRIFIAQPYIVSGSSMDPTFEDSDYLIVDQLSKRFEEPRRKSVLIIRYPNNPSKFFIKRLIAFPRETVQINKGIVTIFNKENPNGIVLDESYIAYTKNEDFSVILGENEYFVMGDNRASSSDSRIWGSLPREYIVGRPILRLLPLNKIDLWPGLPD